MTADGPTYGQDPAAGGWLLDRLDGPWGSVTSVVPSGFDAYARLLHPVDEETGTRWATVAEALGSHVHPLVQWHRLVGLADPYDRTGSPWPYDPEVGTLAPGALRALLAVLAGHTGTAEACWFCTWEGFGWITGSPAVVVVGASDPVPPGMTAEALAADRVDLPGRSYLLGAGPLRTATGNGWQVNPDWFEPQSPNLFWPEDRAWVVGTEIDVDSTLVAGTQQLVDELVADPALEVLQVEPTTPLTADADTVNGR